jgi:hypothetical protein
VRVAVTDAGSSATPAVTCALGCETSGRGLALLEVLAKRWGYHGDRNGRTVWFEFST